MGWIHNVLIKGALSLATILLSLLVFANTPTESPEGIKPTSAIGFSLWKQQQVADAQNKVVRISNAITMLKQKAPLTPKQSQEIEAMTKDQAQALTALQVSKELSYEDYLVIYIQPQINNETFIKSAAQQMSPDEVQALLAFTLRRLNTEAESSDSSVLGRLPQ